MKHLDLRVYVITSDVPELGRGHEDVARAAIAGGATAIQFRDKNMDNREFTETAKKLLALSRASGVPLIINDRVEVAVAVGADGVHIGRTDGDARAVKKILPDGMILGVSATDYQESVDLGTTDAAYLGVGPIFATISKDDASPAIGSTALVRICRDLRKPVVAIGGINEDNLRNVIEAGAAGVAVISAVTHAADMRAAVSRLRSIWDQAVR